MSLKAVCALVGCVPETRFNPCCNGMSLKESFINEKLEKIVLILVVMECL